MTWVVNACYTCYNYFVGKNYGSNGKERHIKVKDHSSENDFSRFAFSIFSTASIQRRRSSVENAEEFKKVWQNEMLDYISKQSNLVELVNKYDKICYRTMNAFMRLTMFAYIHQIGQYWMQHRSLTRDSKEIIEVEKRITELMWKVLDDYKSCAAAIKWDLGMKIPILAPVVAVMLDTQEAQKIEVVEGMENFDPDQLAFYILEYEELTQNLKAIQILANDRGSFTDRDLELNYELQGIAATNVYQFYKKISLEREFHDYGERGMQNTLNYFGKSHKVIFTDSGDPIFCIKK